MQSCPVTLDKSWQVDTELLFESDKFRCMQNSDTSGLQDLETVVEAKDICILEDNELSSLQINAKRPPLCEPHR